LTKDDGPISEVSYSDNQNHDASFAQSLPAQVSIGRQDYTYGRNASYTPRNGDHHPRDNNVHNVNVNDDFSFMPDSPEDAFYDEGSRNNDSQPKSSRPQYDKYAKRTVLLCNLPDGTTHSDITSSVRGGMLLDIYLRSHDRSASISFLEEAHAQEFYRHVKRHDMYIRGKRVSNPWYYQDFLLTSKVDIRWNDRQFILPGHVANKISIGATRNLVIRNRTPKHTEDAIRDDLEHIHNLVVISVLIDGQNVYVSTNSVHNSMFARTCMMSRT